MCPTLANDQKVRRWSKMSESSYGFQLGRSVTVMYSLRIFIRMISGQNRKGSVEASKLVDGVDTSTEINYHDIKKDN